MCSPIYLNIVPPTNTIECNPIGFLKNVIILGFQFGVKIHQILVWKHTNANTYGFPFSSIRVTGTDWWIFRRLDYLPRLRPLHLGRPLIDASSRRLFPRKETDGKFLRLCGRIRISTTLSGPTDWGEGIVYSISENGVGENPPTCQVVPRAQTRHGCIFVTAEPSYFQAKSISPQAHL